MNTDQLADLFEEFAQRLRAMGPIEIATPAKRKQSTRRAGYTTQELSEKTGVPVWTIRRMAKYLDPYPVGGRHGYEFPENAPSELLRALRERESCGKRRGRRPKRETCR